MSEIGDQYRRMMSSEGTFDLDVFTAAWQAAETDLEIEAELRQINARTADVGDPWEAEWLETPAGQEHLRRLSERLLGQDGRQDQ